MLLPPNEPERLAALRSHQILDTPPELAYDDLTQLAARICQCPVAYIKFIDEARAWFKSKVGFPPELTEVPREITICATTICQSDLVVIPDLAMDERFRDNPTVAGWPHLRFYCGMPLIDEEGHALGTLCVVDFEPREVNFEQREAIRTLAHEVVGHLQIRRTSLRLAQSLAELDHAKRLIEAERERSDTLLHNILPREIADELKTTGRVRARYHPLATVLFADFQGFTRMAATMEPARLVDTLDHFFGVMDELVERHGLEKIKTIGDCYMCAGGVPTPGHAHVVDTCLAALAIQACVGRMNREREKLRLPAWPLRVGINAGPVMAGVVGRRKFTYDIWGDTVNVAQRLESAGEPGRVNVSESVHERVKHLFECEPRGAVEVRGRGAMPMHFLNRIRPELSADAEGVAPNAAFARERLRP